MKTRYVKIITLGCRVNHYESRALSEALEKYGFVTLDDDESKKADCVILNSCAVTSESERKSRQLIRQLIRNNYGCLAVIMGCASQFEGEKLKNIAGLNVIWGCGNKTALAQIIADSIGNTELKDKCILYSQGFETSKPLCDNSITGFDRVRAYIKIEDGCNGHCAYCIIPHLRGGVVLRDEDEILTEVKTLANGGCSEVVLTGIETDAYGDRLAPLIQKVAQIDGIERIRLGSLDPAFVSEKFLSQIVNIPQFMPHFHLSLQSGCSKTLASMKRRYNAQQAEKRIELIRQYYPECGLSADIIVGFPGETEQDFEESADFVCRAMLLHAHIFPYSRRSGTVADTMPYQIEEQEKKRRLEFLSLRQIPIEKVILQRYSQYSTLPVLFETYKNGIWTGHTPHFAVAHVRSELDLKGKIIDCVPYGNDGNAILVNTNE